MSAASPDPAPALAALAAVLGPGDLITDPSVRGTFERDWTGRYGAESLAVARPRDTGEVAEVIRICREHALEVVPQGGNTGLVGGGVPRPTDGPSRSVVLSTGGLDGIGEIDRAGSQIELGAGVTLADLQAKADAAGLAVGLDLAARDSATVGGLVACDAGGAKAIRYGTARNMVVGIEAVTGDGRVLRRMSGLEKDNSGYGLPGLLVGSEGTLAVITSVLWKLVPRLPARATAMIGLDRFQDGIELLEWIRARMSSVEAFEFVVGSAFELAREKLGRSPLFDGPAPALYVLIDCVDEQTPIEVLAEELDEFGVERALLVDDSAARERLWECRERLTEVINSIAVPLKIDIGVPVRELPSFLERVERVIRSISSEAVPVLFGHMGDGNVHVNVLHGGDSDGEIAAAVVGLALDHGGTMSAEHGVGASKAAWLERALGAEEVDLMKELKSVFDPDWILNPGVIYP